MNILRLMNVLCAFMITALFALILPGCNGAADTKSDVTPAQSPPSPTSPIPPSIAAADAPSPKSPVQGFSKVQSFSNVQSFSEILGDWDIIRFDGYEPSGLSSDGKNNAFVTFSPAWVGLEIGCNRAGFKAKLTPLGELENTSLFAGLMATQIGCSPERQTRDEQLFAFFDSQPKIVAISASRLRLTSKDHELLLERRDNSPSQLNGIWQLQYVDGVNVSYIAIATPDSLRFDYLKFFVNAQDAGVVGYDGCNQIGRRITIDKQSLSFGPRLNKLAKCPKSVEKLSGYYEAALSDRAEYKVDGRHLIITINSKTYAFAQLEKPPNQPTSTLNIKAYTPAPMPQGDGSIIDNPLTRKTEGGAEHFFLDEWGKWQFADKADPQFSELGPDYLAASKSFVKFNPRREMWGQYEGVYFYRRYAFDDVSVTFTPDPRRRGAAKLSRPANAENTDAVSRPLFMGRYEMRTDGEILTLTQGVKTIRLEPYVKPAPLPPLAKDQALCEIRDVKPGESFPDYPKTELPQYEYTVMGSHETLMWDHQGGMQGSVELADGQAVLFESESEVKVLRKISPYPTSVKFSRYGLYCMYWGEDSGRSWPTFIVAPDLDPSTAPNSAPLEANKMDGESLIVEENNCVRIQRSNGELYTPIFRSYDFIGYDDFGFFLKDKNGVKKRMGDHILPRALGRVIDNETDYKDIEIFVPSCPTPARIFIR